MDSDLVIKVKYGDTLRRFSVLRNGNVSLDLDMAGLRSKIVNLFKFTTDADLTLSYVDEDNDLVTLVDDADLKDAIKQHLDPLRIFVSLNDSAENFDRSGSSTPLRSPNYTAGSPFPHMRLPPPPSVLRGRSKLTPMEPTRSFATQNSNGLASKASPSTEPAPAQEPSLSKLVNDLFSKVALAAPEQYRDFISKLSQDMMSKATAAAPVPLMFELVETLSKLGMAFQDPVSKDQVVEVSKEQSDLEKARDCKFNDEQNACKGSMSSFSLNTKSRDLTVNADNVNTSIPPFVANVDPNTTGVSPGSDFNPLLCRNSGKMPQTKFDGYPNGNLLPSPAIDLQAQGTPNVALQVKDSVSGQMGRKTLSSLPDGGFDHTPFHSRKIYKNVDNMGRIFHQGIICDGCGVHPITGPRYKSTVKEDYDLCSICFTEMGNEADYTRMDRPMCTRPRPFAKFHHARVERPLVQPHGLRSCGMGSSFKPKLDSRFIEDVNILDGTNMAPLTHFTKIWRMHNNGAVAWPRGTRLVWIGGDKLTSMASHKLELPIEGCLVGMELNVAVEFAAPELPGQYVSYWRMALPSGQIFGQCIWVLIKVDNQGDTVSECFQGLNLNLPPDNGDLKDQIIDMNFEHVNTSQQDANSNISPELVKPMVDGCTSKEMEAMMQLIIPPEVPGKVSYPSIDPSLLPSEPTVVTDVQTLSGEVSEVNALEKSLLDELNVMGFKEIDLNKEILRANKYDLESSLDELCALTEWDPMLEELQEMGFHDKETNRKLLIKNNGSIKRVVMDLIASEIKA